MYKYEMALVVSAKLDDESRAAVVERAKSYIERAGGVIGKVEEWGNKRLAYEIAHQREGYYYFIPFEAEPTCPAEVEREARIMDHVLRYLIVRRDEEFSEIPASSQPASAPARPSGKPYEADRETVKETAEETEEVAETAEEAVEEIAETAEEAVEEATEAAEETVEETAEATEAVAEEAAEVAEATEEVAEEAVETMEEVAEAAEEVADDATPDAD